MEDVGGWENDGAGVGEMSYKGGEEVGEDLEGLVGLLIGYV